MKPARIIAASAAIALAAAFTATAAGAQAAPAATCTVTANGACGPYHGAAVTDSLYATGTYDTQDEWNCPCGPQVLTASDNTGMTVTATEPAGNGAVLSYPDIQQTFTDHENQPIALNTIGSMVSTFTESQPSVAGLDSEAAYDIWAPYGTEIMIWVDNHGQTPFGHKVTDVLLWGQHWSVWEGDSQHWALVLDGNETTGTVHVLGLLEYLENHGDIPKNPGLNQVDFGWELCSTGGVSGTYTLTGYTLHTTCKAGGTACMSG